MLASATGWVKDGDGGDVDDVKKCWRQLVWRTAWVWSRIWQKPHISDGMTHRFKGLGLGLGLALVGDAENDWQVRVFS